MTLYACWLALSAGAFTALLFTAAIVWSYAATRVERRMRLTRIWQAYQREVLRMGQVKRAVAEAQRAWPKPTHVYGAKPN